ncbi:MAG: DUF433 domain-containing protein [Chloroflexi bacterium]|nr:DUF433 domain-containing protein [Chloroflexota bacterium]MBI3764653.1 DUF433 domain-containing protein [Chloroflexota bacterium]
MSNSTVTLTITQETFERLSQEAKVAHLRPDDLADELLRVHLQPTEHPYIVRRQGFRGGRPILRGSSLPVWLVIGMWKSGDSIDDILHAYPHIIPAAVYDAISYYFDHRAEIEEQIAENRIERVLAETGTAMDDKGVITLPTRW